MAVLVCVLELPVLRKPEAESEFILCRVALIMWVANHLHQPKKSVDGGPSSITHSTAAVVPHDEEGQHESAHPSLESSKGFANLNNYTHPVGDFLKPEKGKTTAALISVRRCLFG